MATLGWRLDLVRFFCRARLVFDPATRCAIPWWRGVGGVFVRSVSFLLPICASDALRRFRRGIGLVVAQIKICGGYVLLFAVSSLCLVWLGGAMLVQ